MTTRVLDSRLCGGRVRRGGALASAALLFACTTGCACSRSELEAASALGVTSGAQEKETAQMSNVPSRMLGAALDDAARRTSTEREAVEVVLAEPVTWPDGSLGCPQPGMMYTQALVTGYRIVLRAGAQVLNYHAGPSGVPAFCPPEQVMPPFNGGGADRV